ncbi:MAG: thiol reductant ABC exporter subunit CydD [Pigmentiphaga sp.]|nr:thiol reductant ABC exporter subunit CydD [Pigmentiphaga sp.]
MRVRFTTRRARRSSDAPRNAASPGLALQVGASLIWLPQAACIALAIHHLGQDAGLLDILPWALAFLALGLMRAGLDAWGSRLVFASARARLGEYRRLAIAAVSNRSPFDAARPASAAVASTLAEQADHLVPYLTRFLPARAKSTWVPLCILLAVGWFSWAAALVLLAAAPLIPFFMALIGWRAKAVSQAQLVELADMNAFLLDRLRGLATIRALDAVADTASDLGERAQSLRRRIMAVLRIAFLSSAVLELFAALGVALVAVYVGFHLLGQLDFGTWRGKLNLGEALFVLLLAPAFFEPLRDLAAAWHDRASGLAAMQQLAALRQKGLPLRGDALAAAPEPVQAAGARAYRPPAIEFDNVGFRHDDRRPAILRDFHLSVASGEHVALVGPSGAGKSTLLALAAGLLPAQQGGIAIGGLALDDDHAAALRRRMAWISQRPHIFAGSLLRNITLDRDIPPERLEQALHLAALDDLVARRGNAMLAEGGAGLSGGELLRLAIARAAVDPDADLILADEPTAHLDRDTARDITERLFHLAHGKTLLVATHDPVLAKRAKRMVVLKPSPLPASTASMDSSDAVGSVEVGASVERLVATEPLASSTTDSLHPMEASEPATTVATAERETKT